MPESQLKQTPLASPAQDVRNLQQNSTAVASEFRAFLAKMEGKSPKEVLGAIATSGLGKSFFTATFAFAVATAIFTVGPYFWELQFGGAGNEVGEMEETAAAASTSAEQPAANPSPNPATETPSDAAGVNLNNGQEIVDKLGVGDTVTAPLNVNPLESASDDLLEGLD
tara:strand:- start:5336 stop:5839 length:504 start_codon:yes stop_codon:yes gene_type:complete